MTEIPSPEAPKTEPRRRGAQPGNANRRTHGFYTPAMRARRAELRTLAQLMAAGLEKFRRFNNELADLKQSAAPRRKKRESEQQIALRFFSICTALQKMAVDAGFELFEPVYRRTVSNPRQPSADRSNAPGATL